MGKYTKVMQGLPKFVEEDIESEYSKAVKAEMANLAANGDQLFSRFARDLVEAREEKEDLEDDLKKINIRIEALKRMLTNRAEIEGSSSTKLVTGESVSVRPEPYAQVKDKAAFHKWCIDNGYGPQMSLPWQTTNSLVKEALLEGEEPPAGVKAYIVEKIFVTKGD